MIDAVLNIAAAACGLAGLLYLVELRGRISVLMKNPLSMNPVERIVTGLVPVIGFFAAAIFLFYL
jgi:hypothetical protein